MHFPYGIAGKAGDAGMFKDQFFVSSNVDAESPSFYNVTMFPLDLIAQIRKYAVGFPRDRFKRVLRHFFDSGNMAFDKKLGHLKLS